MDLPEPEVVKYSLTTLALLSLLGFSIFFTVLYFIFRASVKSGTKELLDELKKRP